MEHYENGQAENLVGHGKEDEEWIQGGAHHHRRQAYRIVRGSRNVYAEAVLE